MAELNSTAMPRGLSQTANGSSPGAPAGPAQAAREAVLRPQLAALAVLLGLAALPLYVWGGSQIAFLVSCAAFAFAAGVLTALRSRFAPVLLIGEMAFVGTEVNGAIAAGHAPAGTLRLIDISLAVAVAVVAVQRGPGLLRELRGGLGGGVFRALRSFVGRAPLLAGSLVLVAYAVAVWLSKGAPRDAFVKTDVRLILLAFGCWAVASYCVVRPPRAFSVALTLLSAGVALKAIALYAARADVVGNFDRLQATSLDKEGFRVILIGGDTLLTLVPALALLAWTSESDRRRRWLIAACAGLSLVALFAAGTRTSLLITVALAGITALALHRGRMRELVRRPIVIAALALLVVAFAGAAAATGVGERFTQKDKPHVGLNFRRDELSLFFDQPSRDLVVGQGVGGRFLSKDVQGKPALAGWAHSLPLWVILKVGLIGALAALVLLIVAAWRLGVRRGSWDDDRATAGIVFAGLLLMSLTLDRAALPEGAVLVGIAAAWLRPSRTLAAV
jgi:hypothetical protein